MLIRVISQRDIGIFMPLNLSSNVSCFLHFFNLFSELLILIHQIKHLRLCIYQFPYKRNIVCLLCDSHTFFERIKQFQEDHLMLYFRQNGVFLAVAGGLDFFVVDLHAIIQVISMRLRARWAIISS